jgi:glutaminase
VGDWRVPFSIQSVSKVFTHSLVLSLAGDEVWWRVGREPSGDPFKTSNLDPPMILELGLRWLSPRLHL